MANDKLCLLSMSIIYSLTDRKDVFYLWLRGCCKSNKTERKSTESSAIPELGCGAKRPHCAKRGSPPRDAELCKIPSASVWPPDPHLPGDPPVPVRCHSPTASKVKGAAEACRDIRPQYSEGTMCIFKNTFSGWLWVAHWFPTS